MDQSLFAANKTFVIFFLYRSVMESQVTIQQKNQIWIISMHLKHER